MQKYIAACAAVAAVLAAAPAYANVNPDVATVGDIQYNTDVGHVELHEFEISIQGYLSPWSRADVFFSKTPDGFAVEEGNLTLSNLLPADIKARIGRFKMPFGMLNPVHPEKWDFVDEPLVFTRLLGGEDGWEDNGVELSGFVPNPWDQEISLLVDGSNGDNAIAFGRGPVANVRAGTYFEMGDYAGLQLGLSGATEPITPVNGRSALMGADFRYRWRPDVTTAFTLMGEYMQLALPGQAPSGEYVSADYTFGTNYGVDLRLDHAYAVDGSGADYGVALTGSYSLFETTRLKLEAEHVFGAHPDDKFIAQTLFTLGPHTHPLTF
ncbi:MAG TPA: hypothetical protein V6D47_04490 [Oscillatoriaceae cyanobacterium]